ENGDSTLRGRLVHASHQMGSAGESLTVEIAIGGLDDAAVRSVALGSEVMKLGIGAVGRQLEGGPKSVGTAGLCGAVKIVVGSLDESGIGHFTVASEVVKHSDFARGGHLESNAVGVGSAELGDAIEISVGANDKRSGREVAVSVIELIDRGEGACGSDL